jgi:catechol 2,3-dioxygenase-like lactoylglutathione lyase family enzyme
MESTAEIAQHQRPRFAYLHHISLPCRDVEESKRFYTQVLGGELIHDIPDSPRYASPTLFSASLSSPAVGRGRRWSTRITAGSDFL